MKKLTAALLLISQAFLSPAYSSPLLVDLGPNRVVSGVYVDAQGMSYLVGYETNPQTQQRKAILATIPSASSTFAVTTLGDSSATTSSVATSIRGTHIVGSTSNGSSAVNGVAWSLSDPSIDLPFAGLSNPGAGSETNLFEVNSLGQVRGSQETALSPFLGK